MASDMQAISLGREPEKDADLPPDKEEGMESSEPRAAVLWRGSPGQWVTRQSEPALVSPPRFRCGGGCWAVARPAAAHLSVHFYSRHCPLRTAQSCLSVLPSASPPERTEES